MQQGRYKIESICKWKRDNSLSKPIRNVTALNIDRSKKKK